MKKVVLTLCTLAVLGGGFVFAQSSRSARSADDDTEARSRSRSKSKKELTRSEKKEQAKLQKERAKEEKKQQAALEKARKQQEKALKDKERARAKEQRRLERKTKRSADDEEGFLSRKHSKKQEKKHVKGGAGGNGLHKEHVKSKSRSERSKVRSEKKARSERSKVRSEKPVRSAPRSAAKDRSRSKVRSAKPTRSVREDRKARARLEKEERKRLELLKKEEKNQERAQRLADLKTKDLRKKDEHHRERERRAEVARQLALKDQKRMSDQAERLAFARQDRAEKMHRWNELHGLDVNRDVDAGRYADLYKMPAWPVASWFFENKDLLNVSVSYKYATDAYADDRRRFDITGIEFGYKPIQLQDILLASKLVRQAAVVPPLWPIEKGAMVAISVTAFNIADANGILIAGINTIAGQGVSAGANITQAAVDAIKGALIAGKDATGIAQAAHDAQNAIVVSALRDTINTFANNDARADSTEAVNFMQKLVGAYKNTNYVDGRAAGVADAAATIAPPPPGAAPAAGVIVRINAAANAIKAAADKVAAEDYLHYLGDQLITFNGKTEEYGTSIDFSRYVMGKNVQFGVQVPVLYRKNTLTADIATSVEAKTLLRQLSEYQQAANGPFTFMAERYGAEPSLLITDFLQAKGIRQMGGSATGLGDVALFANVQTGARTFEKVLGGLKVTFPTGKHTTTAKLWAPELGTGHTQFSAYASMLMDYNRLLNPHVYIEGIYSMAAHEDKRVPAKIVKSGNTTMTVAGESFAIAAADTINKTQDVIAFGDRVKPVDGQYFDTMDTTIKSIGDNVINLRMLRGMEVKARIGNVIEKFIFRRGFLDLYYDLHAKFKDSAHGYNVQDYNLDILSDRTNLMEHKIGTEFTYQFDPYTRWRAGATYTFAGINAPKTFELSSAFGYSF